MRKRRSLAFLTNALTCDDARLARHNGTRPIVSRDNDLRFSDLGKRRSLVLLTNALTCDDGRLARHVHSAFPLRAVISHFRDRNLHGGLIVHYAELLAETGAELGKRGVPAVRSDHQSCSRTLWPATMLAMANCGRQ